MQSKKVYFLKIEAIDCLLKLTSSQAKAFRNSQMYESAFKQEPLVDLCFGCSKNYKLCDGVFFIEREVFYETM